MKRKITILETTLRDGSYAINYSFTASDTAILCKELEAAGFEYIEMDKELFGDVTESVMKALGLSAS